MKLYEVRDVVREHVGRDKVTDPVLDWCLGRALRQIEQRDDFYWMQASKLFEVVEGQQAYSIRDDIFADDYKSANLVLVSDRTADDPSWHEVSGPESIATTKANFSEADEGCPAFWTLREEGDDPTILFWPPVPDQPYRGELHYYAWTALPTSATSDEHEVLRRWPEALIYLATAQGVLVATKDMEASMFWEMQFINPANQTVSTEYKKIKLYQEQRHTAKRFRNPTSSGATTLASKRAQRQKEWF